MSDDIDIYAEFVREMIRRGVWVIDPTTQEVTASDSIVGKDPDSHDEWKELNDAP